MTHYHRNISENIGLSDDVIRSVLKSINVKENFQIDEETIKDLIHALESDKYTWRSESGLEKELNIDPVLLNALLKSLISQDVVVRAKDSKSGRNLFTTWNHYTKKENVFNKFLNSLSGDLRA